MFEVVLANTVYKAPAILIATGQPYKKLKIANLDKFEGNGVSYCTTCDGYFYRNLKVGVIGYKDYAIHEALELINFTKDITIFTNGNELQLSPEYKDKITDFQINKLKISSIEGKMGVEKIAFENGESDSIDGVFVAYDSASSTDFARKLGIITDKNSVIVDNEIKRMFKEYLLQMYW